MLRLTMSTHSLTLHTDRSVVLSQGKGVEFNLAVDARLGVYSLLLFGFMLTIHNY